MKKIEKKRIGRNKLDVSLWNVSSRSQEHINKIREMRYEDEMDKPLIVMYNSEKDKYDIIDGQHLFLAKDEKMEWECIVVEGDIKNIEDRIRAIEYSYKANMAQKTLSFAEIIRAAHNLKELYYKIYGKEKGWREYVAKILNVKPETVTSYINRYERLVESGSFEYALINRLSASAIDKIISRQIYKEPVSGMWMCPKKWMYYDAGRRCWLPLGGEECPVETKEI